MLKQELIDIFKPNNGIIHSTKFRQKFLDTLESDLFVRIDLAVSFLEVDNVRLSEKIYLILNDVKEQKYCKTCGITLRPVGRDFKEFCSNKCAIVCKEVRDKISKTNRKVFENYDWSERQEKTKQTNLVKYGVEYVSSSPEIQKIKRANKDNISKEGIKVKAARMKEKFAENYDNEKRRAATSKRENTNISRYGSKFGKLHDEDTKTSARTSAKTEERKEKIKQSSLEKYGVEHPMQTEMMKRRIREVVERKKEAGWIYPTRRHLQYPETLGNKDWLHEKYVNERMSAVDIANLIGCTDVTVANYLKYHDIPIKNWFTHTHRELSSFIGQFNFELKENIRAIISPLELDIWIPSKKIAIEYNDIYWHSSNDTETEKPNYHLTKTKLCEESDIQLLHIFENEWIKKRPIVESIIKAKLGVNARIFARNTKIVELTNAQYKNFTNENHIQGYSPATIRFGLMHDDVLISVMSFAKSRYNKNYDWELLRFCNKLNTTVVGGASKLLKYFRKIYSGSIITYADRRYSNGNLYETLGFTFIKNTTPNYFYVHSDNMYKLESRLKFQKHKLPQMLEKFDVSKTEVENMFENGYRRIFDCGNKVYVMKTDIQ